MSVSLEQFISNIIRSGLVSADDLATFQNSQPTDKKPADAKELARDLIIAGKLTKYQAQSIYSGRTSGLVIDQYVVLDKIGEGGMGVVLKGQHRRMKRTVAIKALQTRRLGSAEAVQRFHREVEAVAKLNHQNIVTAHDAREQDGVHYLIMEFVEGQDLASTLHELGPLPIAKALDYVLQTARGLEYAHRQGIIHRDIKPANLLLGKGGMVKILDMGLARLVDEAGATAAQPGSNKGEHLTRTGDVMGTCDYMAPEQGHDSHKVDGRADIYSLGCTLYRLLTGQRPYPGDSMVQVLMAHRNSPIPSPRALRTEVSAELDAVCQKMMAKRPKDRFADMTEVIAALDAIVHPPRPSSASYDEEDSTNTRSLRDNLSFLSPQPTITATARPVDAFKETVSYHQEQDTGSSSAAQGAPLDDDPLREEPPAFVVPPLGGAVPVPPPPIAKPQAAALSAKPASRTSGAHSTKRRKKQFPLIAVILTSLAVIGIGGAFAIYTLPLGEGTVVIENEADLATKDIEVTASHGEEVKVASKQAGWTITLKPGEYKLDVKGTVVGLSNDHIELDQNTIRVTRGSKQVVKIKLVAPQADPEGVEARKLQELAAKELGKPVDYNNSIGMSFVLVPSGAFVMGSPMDWIASAAAEKNGGWFANDPKFEAAHHVRITKPFYLGVYAVTQEQYQHVMGVNPSFFFATGGGSSAVTGEDCSRRPVESVSWDDAQGFCKKLSARPDEKAKGYRYRLPTEAEWEYACRAGTKTLWHFGDDESNFGLYGWCKFNSREKTHPVGEFKGKSNPWGLSDMYGNVWQLCADRYLDTFYSVTEGAADPISSSKNLEEVVIRGGQYGDNPRLCRSGNRGHIYAGADYYKTVGFRVLLETVPSSEPEEHKAELTNISTPSEPEWTDWRDLFDGKTLNGWQQVVGEGYKSGRVKVADGCIDLSVGRNKLDLAGIVATAPIPKINYELLVEAKRIQGADCASIVFPIADAFCTLFVPDDKGCVRLGDVKSSAPNSNGTERPIEFENNVWHKICLRVLASQITVFFDDRKLIELPTAGHLFSIKKGLGLLAPLGIYSFPGWKKTGCNSLIRKIQFRELKPASAIATAGGGLVLPMKQPTPVHVEIKPEPLPEFKPGQLMSRLALVAQPAPIKGVASWTLETVRSRGAVKAMAFNSDGSKLALSGEDGVIRVIDPNTGKLFRGLVSHDHAVGFLSWSPDDRMLLSGGDARPAIVWDVATGQVLRRDVFNCDVDWAAWSPDGHRVAGLCCSGQDVMILDFANGPTKAIPCHDIPSTTRAWGRIAWAPDGRLIAYFRRQIENPTEHDVFIWDVDKLCEVKRMGIKSKWVSDIEWPGDGASILVGTGLYDVATGEKRLPPPPEIVRAALSNDGRKIAFGKSDGSGMGIQIRNVLTGSVAWKRAKIGSARAIAFSPKCDRVFSTNEWNRVTELRVKDGSTVQGLSGHISLASHSAVASPTSDGVFLVVRAGDTERCSIFDIKTPAPVTTFEASYASFDAVWSSNGMALAILDMNQIRVMDRARKNWIGDLAFPHPKYTWQQPCALGISPDGSLIVRTYENTTSVWDVATKKQLWEIKDVSWWIHPFSCDGAYIAIPYAKGIKIYDAKTGAVIRTLDGAKGGPGYVAWSPGDKFLAGERGKKVIDLWDIKSGRHMEDSESLAKIPGLQEGGESMRLDWLDGKTLLIGNNRAAVVWDMPSRSVVRTIEGTGLGTSCSFAPGGRKVVFLNPSSVLVRSLDDSRLLTTLVTMSLEAQDCAFVGPDGHWKGKPELADQFVYVVQTDHGQETLTPAEFEKKYGWKNDPAKAVAK